MTVSSILIVGFLLGMKHATEADHVAAVATLATQQDSLRQTVRQGIAWGSGHSLVLLAFGGLVLVLGKAVPEYVAHLLELTVGAMLIVLGLDALRRVATSKKTHQDRGRAEHLPKRAVVIGMVHGLAGTAAMVLLSIATAPSIAMGVVFIAVFGAGSILGMTLLSVAIAIPLRLSAHLSALMRHGLNLTAGTITCGVGFYIVGTAA